jgi:hypothetical protein
MDCFTLVAQIWIANCCESPSRTEMPPSESKGSEVKKKKKKKTQLNRAECSVETESTLTSIALVSGWLT